MDLSFVKKKLADQANRGSAREKIDYTKIFWKPKVGKYQVRILPNKFRDEWPLREIYMHYGFSKGPILALTNWGEQDPISSFAQKLRKSSDKEDWTLATKIQPKTRYFVPVLVRGEEAAGVRLWEVGKLVNDQLMGIASDEDYGDFTNITDGRDFAIEATDEIIMGKKCVKATLRIKPKTTPISENPELVKLVLEEQPDILAINKKYSYEEIKDLLQKWLNPEEEAAETVDTEDDGEDPFLKEMQEGIPVVETKPVKTKADASTKFDKLFA